MSEKEYTNPDYVAGKIRDSLLKKFKDYTGCDFGLGYHYNHDTKEAMIYFCFSKHKSEIIISKNSVDKEYNAIHRVDEDKIFLYGNIETNGSLIKRHNPIKLKRSKTGRIGDEESSKIAKFFLDDLLELDRK